MTAPTEALPEDVRRFVLTSVPSVPHLEAMLLFEESPQARRSAADVAARLYIAESTARELLDALGSAGIIAAAEDEPGRFRYAPVDAALAGLLERLAVAYRTHLIEITNLIHDRTQRSATHFAQAFRLRKE